LKIVDAAAEKMSAAAQIHQVSGFLPLEKKK
jgi:hypothetical protein